jgi:hypothetical protein
VRDAAPALGALLGVMNEIFKGRKKKSQEKRMNLDSRKAL